ncbi:MAG: class II glutamine amidotransferase [Deltaproteobacteria bacterium]|nr:class II glutamine amidotransferase [Deltaproteobacteria bacterium]
MCELLGMECNVPTDIVFSFTALATRGGRTGPHTDGFGLAFYEGKAARVFLDPNAAAHSPIAEFLRKHSIKTELAIAHIRRRTRGQVTLANTHPFLRELWGRAWVFAHNGTVRGIKQRTLGRFVPIGDTDSEHAFCLMLEALRTSFRDYPTKRSDLREAIAEVASELSVHGTFNFLLGDGRALYARTDTKLAHIVRKAPFGKATLADEEVSVDFAEVTTPRDRVAVVATRPLTVDETWTLGEPGSMWVFEEGRCVSTLASPVRGPRRKPHP